MGEITNGRKLMTAKYNRQARRLALCLYESEILYESEMDVTRARGPRDHKRATSRRSVWLTAYGHDLARVAERIEFELPAELAALLSPACLPTQASLGSTRQRPTEGRTWVHRLGT
jgi:hypothetical protein